MKLIENYKSPTPDKWRKIGDAIMTGSAGLSAVMMGSPLSDHYKLWIVWVLGVVGVTGKVLTNFTTENGSKE